MLYVCEQVHTLSKKLYEKRLRLRASGHAWAHARLSHRLSDVLILKDFAYLV